MNTKGGKKKMATKPLKKQIAEIFYIVCIIGLVIGVPTLFFNWLAGGPAIVAGWIITIGAVLGLIAIASAFDEGGIGAGLSAIIIVGFIMIGCTAITMEENFPTPKPCESTVWVHQIGDKVKVKGFDEALIVTKGVCTNQQKTANNTYELNNKFGVKTTLPESELEKY